MISIIIQLGLGFLLWAVKRTSKKVAPIVEKKAMSFIKAGWKKYKHKFVCVSKKEIYKDNSKNRERSPGKYKKDSFDSIDSIKVDHIKTAWEEN